MKEHWKITPKQTFWKEKQLVIREKGTLDNGVPYQILSQEIIEPKPIFDLEQALKQFIGGRSRWKNRKR